MKRKFYLKPASGSKFLLLLVFLLLTNCAENKLSRQTLVKIYVENLIVEETYPSNADSLRIHKDDIFKENNITPETFNNELSKLQNDPEAWDIFFKRANAMLDSLRRTGKIN